MVKTNDYFTKIFYALNILFLFMILSCSKDDKSSEEYNFNVVPMGESQVRIDWNQEDPTRSISISIDTNALFTAPLIESVIAEQNKTISFDGLSPITHYYLKIEVEKASTIIYTEIKEFSTTYTQVSVNYPSDEDAVICATLCYASTLLTDSSKKAIFMHEYGRQKSRWSLTGVPKELIKKGYLCLLFDFRAHGCSTYTKDISTLMDEPYKVKIDFDAAVRYLDTVNLKCSDEIVVFGASLGACVATAASSYENVIGGAALSAVENLSVTMASTGAKPKGMFFIAGELDKNDDFNVDCALDAQKLYDLALEPKKLKIISNTAEHGVDLLSSNTQLEMEILNWIDQL